MGIVFPPTDVLLNIPSGFQWLPRCVERWGAAGRGQFCTPAQGGIGVANATSDQHGIRTGSGSRMHVTQRAERATSNRDRSSESVWHRDPPGSCCSFPVPSQKPSYLTCRGHSGIRSPVSEATWSVKPFRRPLRKVAIFCLTQPSRASIVLLAPAKATELNSVS